MTEKKANVGRIGVAEILPLVIIPAAILSEVLSGEVSMRMSIIVALTLALTLAFYSRRVTGRHYPMWYKIAAGVLLTSMVLEILLTWGLLG